MTRLCKDWPLSFCTLFILNALGLVYCSVHRQNLPFVGVSSFALQLAKHFLWDFPWQVTVPLVSCQASVNPASTRWIFNYRVNIWWCLPGDHNTTEDDFSWHQTIAVETHMEIQNHTKQWILHNKASLGTSTFPKSTQNKIFLQIDSSQYSHVPCGIWKLAQ